jgi:uncharacterized membrane protein
LERSIITWAAQAPPENWAQLLDVWWQWHVVRTLAGIASLSFTLLAVLGARKAAA